MRTNCSNCPHGGYDPCSDICDGCMGDLNTGFGGFYDHRINKGFMSEEEQNKYYRENEYTEDEYDE